jgi:hypothetical protein
MSIDPTPRSPVLTPAYLTGCDSSPLLDLGDGQRLLPEVADALGALVDDARRAGFDLRIASAWRSFERQRDIFNAKIRGERAVLDDADRPVDLSRLSEREVVHAILRFSALPGASRHHWGTDLDVFDAATLPAGGKPALSQAEVCAGGVFDALHCWLDECIASGRSHGFYRPYDRDRGGVAAERWHLSYAPLAGACAAALDERMLRACWAREPGGVALQALLEAELPALFARYVSNVAPAPAAV